MNCDYKRKQKSSLHESFRILDSHLTNASLNNELNGTSKRGGFKRAFANLFRQNDQTFTGTMFLNMDQLEKQFDKEEFQDIRSMKSIDERALHKREYDSRVNERQLQTKNGKVNTCKALDASLVDTESSGTSLKEQDTSNISGNNAHVDDANIKPIYDEEPMAEVQTTAEINVFAIGQQHTEQPEFNNEGEVDQNAEQCHDTCPLPATLTDNQTTELSNQSLESENILLKEGQHGQFLKVKSNEAKVKHDIDVIETINIELEHKVAKLLKENETLKKHYKEMFDSIKTTRAKNIEHTTSLIANNDKFKAQLQEKGFAIAALKNELRKLTGNSMNTKFAKLSILGKPALQPRRNQSVVRQPTAFKSERPRISKQRFASQVDVNNDLSKPVTTHYLPKEKESAVAKPQHMIAPGSSWYSSNDMVHDHYLEEANKKTQESFNSRAKVPPNKTTKRYIPVEQTSFAKKPERQIPKSHRSSIKKTSVVHEKTMTPRSCRRWKPTGKLFKTIGLKWIPTGKILNSSTTKVDSDPTNGTSLNPTKAPKQQQQMIPQTTAISNIKLPILKKEEYDIWAIGEGALS
ncbi:hypothetical protein Tco_0773938 [Tanacetum coccineum]|uniref:Uncharacterized protein n=1 Tax=Tanacetum coccineum TaxID=301880 RepID=A0ABQ4ZQT2_9ASTR